MSSLTPSQKLATKIALNKNITQKTKIKLLTCISENQSLLNNIENNDEKSFVFTSLFEIYVNHLISPPPQVTGLFLSTRFSLNLNKTLTQKSLLSSSTACDDKKLYIDVSPLQCENLLDNNDTEFFTQKHLSAITELLNICNTSKPFSLKPIFRICDPFSNSGEIVWFDPFIPPYNMSVRWGLNSYTVRDIHTTYKMCNAARNLFSDYITIPPNAETAEFK
jgi:hypothetical protein